MRRDDVNTEGTSIMPSILSVIRTKEAFLKTIRPHESLSSQIFIHPLWVEYSMAKMNPMISEWKIDALPMIQENGPRNVPRWSRNNPPQAACAPTTEPSVLTLTQGEVAAFHKTVIISLICQLLGETEKESRKLSSKTKHHPAKALPLIASKEWMWTFSAWREAVVEENRIAFRAI